MLRFFVVLISSFFMIQGAFAQMRGGIKGRVTDENSGDPVAFAQLILLQEDALVQVTVADDKGNFFMGNILPGQYAILARSTGFSPLKITDIPLAEGEWLDVSPVFAGESFEMDTLVQKYEPHKNSNHKQEPKKGNSPNKTPKKTAYQRKLEREARKLG